MPPGKQKLQWESIFFKVGKTIVDLAFDAVRIRILFRCGSRSEFSDADLFPDSFIWIRILVNVMRICNTGLTDRALGLHCDGSRVSFHAPIVSRFEGLRIRIPQHCSVFVRVGGGGGVPQQMV
jgi:hypothetical protein